MSMYNLIEYGDNYSDTSGSLWQFKRDNRVLTCNVKIAALLKYLSNFWRSLEMLLIICKIHLELNWNKNCVMLNIDRNTT